MTTSNCGSTHTSIWNETLIHVDILSPQNRDGCSWRQFWMTISLFKSQGDASIGSLGTGSIRQMISYVLLIFSSRLKMWFRVRRRAVGIDRLDIFADLLLFLLTHIGDVLRSWISRGMALPSRPQSVLKLIESCTIKQQRKIFFFHNIRRNWVRSHGRFLHHKFILILVVSIKHKARLGVC